MNNKILKIFVIAVVLVFSVSNIALAKKQKFISIEPHLGYSSTSEFYVGGKVYNYEGLNWSRKSYYNKPDLILEFNDYKMEFKPDSEGYFWVKVPMKPYVELTCGASNCNQVAISLDKNQQRKNKNLILVTSYGLNTDKIYIPFLFPDPNAKFGIISNFDDTITKVKGLGFIEFITTNPDHFKLREGIAEAYQKIHNNINPIFYVTARPNGTYKVIETLIEENKLPIGPIMARNLGFWFLNKGVKTKEHKTKAIEEIMTTLAGKRFIFIGDNTRTDLPVYLDIYNKYPKRVIKIFIFKNKNKFKKDKYSDIVFFVDKPEEIVEELQKMGQLD